ncbi:venom acid phosphatase Acph-1 [Megalopta genalis]|uniref:venom acid phosphatase Acph-1 n=1 Tax=Megalopta genalis TaxID=115081 RepID=UPI003FD4743D
MKRLNLILILLVCVPGLLHYSVKAELKLQLVQVLFRHGERTPIREELWPKDPNDLSVYEPMGLGQLTNMGKVTEYDLGKLLRKRYDKFLGDVYHPTDLYAQSTDVDRTKMSLQLVLAALYPPSAEQAWNKRMPWMPIPIHYIPEIVDYLMKPDFMTIYLEALKNVRNLEEIRRKVSQYDDFLNFLSEKTGITEVNVTRGYKIYNNLSSQKSMNLTIPEWCTKDVIKTLQSIVILEYEIRSHTTQLKRLNGGPLIRTFIENIQMNEGRKRPRKIYLYSGHETNIAGFARAHNFTEPALPNYGTAIIFEKLSDEAGKKFVKLFLWTGVTAELIPYKFNDHDEVLTFDKYKELVNDVLPSNKEIHSMWDYLSKDDLYKLYEEKDS